MEHAFDTLSKNLAGGMSRRKSFGLLLRGAFGFFLAGLSGRSAKAQSGPCSACGTCQAVDFQTGAVTSCTNQCEAQTLCGQVQSYSPYNLLVATLASYGYQFASYGAVTTSGSATAAPQAFGVAYTNPNSVGTAGPFGGGTATLNVAFLAGGGMSALAVAFDSNGNPVNGYAVNSSGGVEVIVPTQIPNPFIVSVSPAIVSVVPGSSATTNVTVAVNTPFESTIVLGASGLPAGVNARFDPSSIAFPGSGSSTMKVRANSTAAPGTYPIAITGTGRKIVETAALSLVVEAPAFVASDDARPDEIDEDSWLQSRIEASDVTQPFASNCPYCLTVCGVIGELSQLACVTTFCALFDGAPFCGFIGNYLCAKPIKALCTYGCEKTHCDPPPCTNANCPPPATCQQNVCVTQTCYGSTPCTGGSGPICCELGTICCPESYPTICNAYSC